MTAALTEHSTTVCRRLRVLHGIGVATRGRYDGLSDGEAPLVTVLDVEKNAHVKSPNPSVLCLISLVQEPMSVFSLPFTNTSLDVMCSSLRASNPPKG